MPCLNAPAPVTSAVCAVPVSVGNTLSVRGLKDPSRISRRRFGIFQLVLVCASQIVAAHSVDGDQNDVACGGRLVLRLKRDSGNGGWYENKRDSLYHARDTNTNRQISAR